VNPPAVNEKVPSLMNEKQQQNDDSVEAKVITMEELNRKIEYYGKYIMSINSHLIDYKK